MIRVVSIKFRAAGKLYDFDARDHDLKTGEQVIVETDRGRALGSVVVAPRQIPRKQLPDSIKAVLRPANPQDLESAQKYAAREEEAYRFCQQRIQDRNMEMKLVRAEYLFDGSKIIFFFTADGRVDFRELVKDLAHYFHTRIEMRQIGVRDEAKITGGLGICGRELCCCTFLRDFQPVSVKMAKEQGLALNPNKISGQCGRLLCCLGYEFETYCSLRKGLPKYGKKLQYEGQSVEVVSQDVLSQKVRVKAEDNTQFDVSAAELKKGSSVQTEQTQGQDAPKTRNRPARRSRTESKTGPANAKAEAQSPDKAPKQDKQAPQEEEKKKRRRRRRPRRKGGASGQPAGKSPEKPN